MSSGIDALLANEEFLEKLRRQRVALLTNTSCRTSTGKETFRALNDALSTSSKTGVSNLFVPHTFITLILAPAISFLTYLMIYKILIFIAFMVLEMHFPSTKTLTTSKF